MSGQGALPVMVYTMVLIVMAGLPAPAGYLDWFRGMVTGSGERTAVVTSSITFTA